MKNTEKKLTDEEILRTFRLCGGGGSCVGCLYRTTKERCNMKKLHSDVYEIAKRLQGKVTKLREENERLTKLAELRKRDNDETCEELFKNADRAAELQKQVDTLTESI